MSKVNVKLEEAKKILESEKVFLNENNKFNFVDSGKYESGFTIVIPSNWNLNLNEEPESPIKYKEVKELTDGMNLDFNGKSNGVTVLFGKYRLSKNEKNVFELTSPTKAKDVLISVEWGGAFEKSGGQDKEYANEAGATTFVKRGSNGGGMGVDYWVVPVNYIKDKNKKRDVSSILEKIEYEENERIQKIDNQISKNRKDRENSRNNRDRITNTLKPIITEIKEYYPSFEFNMKEEYIEYVIPNYFGTYKSYYDDKLVDEIKEILEKERIKKIQRDEFEPKFKELTNFATMLDLDIEFRDRDLILENNYYKYNEEDYNKFIEKLNSIKDRKEKEKLESLRKEIELKQKLELDNKKAHAKEKKYPEKFQFENRLSGKTNLSHAFVVDDDGSIRNPDDNVLSNRNHMYKYKNNEWKIYADGTQVYDQIYEGEVIVSYTKENSSTPYVLNVEWTDGKVNDTQKEVIYSSLIQHTSDGKIVDINYEEINNLNEWLENSLNTKAKECIQQLNLSKEKEELISEIDKNVNKLYIKIEKINVLEKNIENGNRLENTVETEINKKEIRR